MKRYIRILIDSVDEIPPGEAVTDFEGIVAGDDVRIRARKVWDDILDRTPEQEPMLWAFWLHWVHNAVENGEYDTDELLIEVLAAMQMFLACGRGVFLNPDAKPRETKPAKKGKKKP